MRHWASPNDGLYAPAQGCIRCYGTIYLTHINVCSLGTFNVCYDLFTCFSCLSRCYFSVMHLLVLNVMGLDQDLYWAFLFQI